MRTSLVRKLCLALLVLPLAVAACGDDDDTGMNPNPPPNNGGRMVLANPSFGTNIVEIFNRNGCANGTCHGSPGEQAGLNLETNAHGNLVSVASTQVGTLNRVEPNNPTDSYLVIKLEGTDARMQGQQMPAGGGQLDTIDINNIKNWINNGAPNN